MSPPRRRAARFLSSIVGRVARLLARLSYRLRRRRRLRKKRDEDPHIYPLW